MVARYNANRVEVSVPVPAMAMDLARERVVRRLFCGEDWKERDVDVPSLEVGFAEFADVGSGAWGFDDFAIVERKARKSGDLAPLVGDHRIGMLICSVD